MNGLVDQARVLPQCPLCLAIACHACKGLLSTCPGPIIVTGIHGGSHCERPRHCQRRGNSG